MAYIVSSGITSDGIILENDSMTVLNGGTANSTTVKNGGNMYIQSGGTGNETTFYSDGSVHVSDGGKAYGNVLNGGVLHVYSDGEASGTVVKGGAIAISSGGTANNTTVNSRGSMFLFSGGTANNTIVNSSAIINIQKGATLISTTINDMGSLRISSGMMANDTFITSGGTLCLAGGTANNVDVSYRGILYLSGGTANNVVVNPNGYMDCYLGAATIIENGGFVLAQRNTITFIPNSFSGLVLSVYSSASVHSGTTAHSTVIKELGYLHVFSEGLASDTTIESFGTLNISKGGIASETTINSKGTLNLSSGGTAINTKVNNLGSMNVLSRGRASNTTVNSLGALYVSNYGSAEEIVENGGYVVIASSASATFASNTFYGLELIGQATVHSGTTAVNTNVSKDGQLYVFNGGLANSTTINSKGNLVVSSNGVVNSTEVNSSGGLTVSIGGQANNTTVNSGGRFHILNGIASGTVVNDHGLFVVDNGAKTTATLVNQNGSMYISSGGTAHFITENGGYVFLGDNANVSFESSFLSSLVLNNDATAHSGTTATNTLISGGNFQLFSGGIVNGTTIYGNGSLTVLSGGIADTIKTYAGGSLHISSGGILTGEMRFLAGAIFMVEEGAVVNFDLTRVSAGEKPILNDWSLIQGKPDFAITVNDDQEPGIYNLADEANDFEGAIMVQTTLGEALGTLTIDGGKQSFKGVEYALNLSNGLLSVAVNMACSAPAKSDIDGNGVSDVMFQWTGGDYQVGYWMNGTSEWQGQGRGRSSAWNMLGSFDMNADGKADMLMTGKATLVDMTGIYIGYFADSIDVDANWHTVGFLVNSNDWVNSVGNLTGADGKNSIVWYAPELYSLGVWTDGTDNWTAISDQFGGDDWTLVGCGDFDGDGKDSVVMAFNGGANYYAVGLDGAAAEIASADGGWAVRAIGDFSCDGRDDIVVFHKETGLVAKWADGNSENWSQLGQLDAKDWFVVGCGDYNDDQHDDLLVRQYSTGMLGYYTSGDMNQWNVLGYGVDMDWTVIAYPPSPAYTPVRLRKWCSATFAHGEG